MSEPIPPGTVLMSLDPRQGGDFFYHGLRIFIQGSFAANQPKTVADLEQLLDYYVREGENLLRRSRLLKDLDIDKEESGDEIWERLLREKESQEFAALLMVSAAKGVKEILKKLEANGEAQFNARELVFATYMATIGYSLYLVKDEHFEKTLWYGQQSYRFLSKVEDVAAQTPAEIEALEKLKPLFERQSEKTLRTWLKDGRPIASRLRVEGIPEETLRAQCKYYYEQFERRRREEQQREEIELKKKELKAKYIGTGFTAAAGLWAVLKYGFEVL